MSDIDLNKIIVELVKEFSLPIYANAKKFGVDSLDKLKVIQNKCFTKYLKISRNCKISAPMKIIESLTTQKLQSEVV